MAKCKNCNGTGEVEATTLDHIFGRGRVDSEGNRWVICKACGGDGIKLIKWSIVFCKLALIILSSCLVVKHPYPTNTFAYLHVVEDLHDTYIKCIYGTGDNAQFIYELKEDVKKADALLSVLKKKELATDKVIEALLKHQKAKTYLERYSDTYNSTRHFNQ